MHIIGGKYKKKALLTPKTETVRPTTSQLREALFNITQSVIEKANFLDIFAGSGAMGLEALSRGAAHATFIDNNRAALMVIKKNIAALEVEACTTVLGMDALRALEKLRTSYDLIYIDPPYGKGLSALVLTFIDTHALLAEEGSLFIEESDFHAPVLHSLHLRRVKKVGRAHLYEYIHSSGN